MARCTRLRRKRAESSSAGEAPHCATWLAQFTVARDLCRTDIPVLLPDDDLESALNRLTEAGTAEAIVSSNEGDTPVVLGILTREGALDAWRRATQIR